ncbi:MAG TPA: hypothetical protein VMT86_21535 [Bryobacteraceae bacterium]|nr:hypothetical protein [Bryobacteraceae bacterium]
MEKIAAGAASLKENMRQEASFFEGKEPVLVYIAKRLNEALRLESIFSNAGVDYGVEADEYRGGFIFQRVRTGAFFYVLPEEVDKARQVMRENDYKPSDPPQKEQGD